MELAFFILLATLIYGTLNHRCCDKNVQHAGEQIVPRSLPA